MKILIDMNLSPEWIVTLNGAGHQAVHWSQTGDPKAEDAAIMEWARENEHVILTHDIDFSTLLALTYAIGPSVLLVRTQDVLPASIGEMICEALARHQGEIAQGALVVLDAVKSRVRLLPIKPPQ